jgi:hypothetical protein
MSELATYCALPCAMATNIDPPRVAHVVQPASVPSAAPSDEWDAMSSYLGAVWLCIFLLAVRQAVRLPGWTSR